LSNCNALTVLKQADLMLVIGTSLRVAPVSEILPQLPPSIPVLLINRELVGQPHCFDVELLGDSDVVVEFLSRMLDEESVGAEGSKCHGDENGGKTTESFSINPSVSSDPAQAAEIVASGGVVRWLPRPSTFLFPGFALPQSVLQDPSSLESDIGSDRGCEEDGIDNDDIDSNSLFLENLHRDEGSVWKGHETDLVGEYAHTRSESSEGGTLCDQEYVGDLVGSSSFLVTREEIVHETPAAVIYEQDEQKDCAVTACESVGSGGFYDSSWGIQRRRPETSIMASCRRPG
jgi:hypothetical protein